MWSALSDTVKVLEIFVPKYTPHHQCLTVPVTQHCQNFISVLILLFWYIGGGISLCFYMHSLITNWVNKVSFLLAIWIASFVMSLSIKKLGFWFFPHWVGVLVSFSYKSFVKSKIWKDLPPTLWFFFPSLNDVFC